MSIRRRTMITAKTMIMINMRFVFSEIMPHVKRSPALPVASDPASPPRPWSSSSACMTRVLPMSESSLNNDDPEGMTILILATPFSSASMFPKSPTWRISDSLDPWLTWKWGRRTWLRCLIGIREIFAQAPFPMCALNAFDELCLSLWIIRALKAFSEFNGARAAFARTVYLKANALEDRFSSRRQ